MLGNRAQSEALVIASVLASVELWPPELRPPTMQFAPQVLKVAADGRCFWSSLWLATKATKTQIWSWAHRVRNGCGFAGGNDLKVEKELVWEWLETLLETMPEGTQERVKNSIPAENDDLVP